MKQVIDLYQQGFTKSEISRKTSIPRTTVRRIISKFKESQTFKIGDRVLINGKGSRDIWSEDMQMYVGAVGTITDFDTDGTYEVKFEDRLCWWFNYENLESLSEETLQILDNYKQSEAVLDDAPLSETIIPKRHDGTREELIEDIRTLAIANPELAISRNWYRINGTFSESNFSQFFGTFHEFKRQAGIVLTRQQHHLEKQIAKHASVDHYREMNNERHSYGDKYDKPSNKRFKQVVIVGDLHDKNVDPFYMDVLIDTLQRVQPDVIVLNGDIFDLQEFSKYHTDPRDFDVVGRIQFVHEHILKRIRTVCPHSQVDFIEGNHEARLLKHLADATPALRCVLSDLHGMTVSSLLGLDKFQINYIAKGDLSAYNIRDVHKEISKNYKVYFDSFIVSHEGTAKNLGFPGCNGHHHKTVIESLYNEHFGTYNWVQHGCGHRLDAEYCHPKWANGFVIATCDIETKRTVFDTITFQENFAIVGGVFYERV